LFRHWLIHAQFHQVRPQGRGNSETRLPRSPNQMTHRRMRDSLRLPTTRESTPSLRIDFEQRRSSSRSNQSRRSAWEAPTFSSASEEGPLTDYRFPRGLRDDAVPCSWKRSEAGQKSSTGTRLTQETV